MAKSIKLLNATYPDVPSVILPTSTGGTAKFIEEDELITVYTGATDPPSSLGKNGDIYLKVVG